MRGFVQSALIPPGGFTPTSEYAGERWMPPMENKRFQKRLDKLNYAML